MSGGVDHLAEQARVKHVARAAIISELAGPIMEAVGIYPKAVHHNLTSNSQHHDNTVRSLAVPGIVVA